MNESFWTRCECNGDFNSNGQGECNSSDEGGPFCYVYPPLLWDFYNQSLQQQKKTLGFCHRSKLVLIYLSIIRHSFSSDTTCEDVRAQYFFVWGVSIPKITLISRMICLLTCHWQGHYDLHLRLIVSQVYMVSTPDGYNPPIVGLVQCVSIVLGSQVYFNGLLADPRVEVECWVRKGDGALCLSHLASVGCMLARVFLWLEIPRSTFGKLKIPRSTFCDWKYLGPLAQPKRRCFCGTVWIIHPGGRWSSWGTVIPWDSWKTQ